MTSKWYIGGLHFECAQCGQCCSGPEEGFIWITKPEIEMLAEHLKQTTQQVRKKYIKRFGLRCSIKEDPRSKDCVFLTGPAGGKGCAIYHFRPTQCRTWPFWTSNLRSPDDWNAAAMRCPGMNRGRLYTFEEIEELKNKKRWWGE